MALYVVEATFSHGFESYLRSHSFVQFTDGLVFGCPAIFKTLGDFRRRLLRSAKIASVRESIALRTLSGIKKDENVYLDHGLAKCLVSILGMDNHGQADLLYAGRVMTRVYA